MILRLGSRGSPLALWQAHWVRARLEALVPGASVEITIIQTSGDRFLDTSLARIGGKGLFVKEIEDALLERRIDLAVHSLKDVPAELPSGLELVAYPEREDPRDVAVFRRDAAPALVALPSGARVGTTSLRRQSQLLALRDDLTMVPLRGNVGTRLAKLDRGEVDAILLARAGLARLGLDDRVGQVFEVDEMLPAVGQGVLAIETRADDAATRAAVELLDCAASRVVVDAERAFLRRLEAGCTVPVGGHATVIPGASLGKVVSSDADSGARVRLCGVVASPDGRAIIRRESAASVRDAAPLGRALAEEILAAGGAAILTALASQR